MLPKLIYIFLINKWLSLFPVSGTSALATGWFSFYCLWILSVISTHSDFPRYWVVVSLFLLVEPLLDLLPLPFITIVKLVGLAWCLASEPISGSRIIFDQVSLFYITLIILPEYCPQIHPVWEESRTKLELWANEASGSDVGALLMKVWRQREDVWPFLNTQVMSCS